MADKAWIVSIGSNRGTARLWLQGKKLHDAGFIAKQTQYFVTIDKYIRLYASPDGNRRVSGKGDMPIIDINSADLLKVGRVGTKLQITVKSTGDLVLEPVRKDARKAA